MDIIFIGTVVPYLPGFLIDNMRRMYHILEKNTPAGKNCELDRVNWFFSGIVTDSNRHLLIV